jgi:hypothetical protein
MEPDPTPDPTPFVSDFKDAKKVIFLILFSYNLPKGTLSSVLRTKLLFKNFNLLASFQSSRHIYEKR